MSENGMSNTELRNSGKTKEWKNRFFDLSMDLLSVAGLDGYLKYVNKSWEKVLGWSREELLSRPFLDFIHPDDRKHSEKALEQLKKGIPVIEFENRQLCKDGTYRIFSWNATSVMKDKLVFSVTRDITEHSRGERAREESEARYKTLFESANDAIFLMDRERFVDCNR